MRMFYLRNIIYDNKNVMKFCGQNVIESLFICGCSVDVYT